VKIVKESLRESRGLMPLKRKPLISFTTKNEQPERIGDYIMPPHGWGNGYVAVPPGHPLYRVPYDNMMNVDIHGGLTFSELATDFRTLPPELDGYEDYWVFGFDTNHWSDTPQNWPKERVEEETQNLKEQIETYEA
jgi:hypothetical protein